MVFKCEDGRLVEVSAQETNMDGIIRVNLGDGNGGVHAYDLGLAMASALAEELLRILGPAVLRQNKRASAAVIEGDAT